MTRYYVTMNDGTEEPIDVIVLADNKPEAIKEAEHQYPGWIAIAAMDQEDRGLQLAEDYVAAGERAADEIYCSYFE